MSIDVIGDNDQAELINTLDTHSVVDRLNCCLKYQIMCLVFDILSPSIIEFNFNINYR